MVAVRPGQRVRVTYEGIASSDTANPDSKCLWISDRGGELLAPLGHPDVTVELVEPEYLDMEAYRDSEGFIFQFDADMHCWWEPGSERETRFEAPARPLVHLVPESP